jgi:hypothetical protein
MNSDITSLSPLIPAMSVDNNWTGTEVLAYGRLFAPQTEKSINKILAEGAGNPKGYYKVNLTMYT